MEKDLGASVAMMTCLRFVTKRLSSVSSEYIEGSYSKKKVSIGPIERFKGEGTVKVEEETKRTELTRTEKANKTDTKAPV